MKRFKCVFTVYEGSRLIGRNESIVSANDSATARKLIEAQYSGCRIVWISVTAL